METGIFWLNDCRRHSFSFNFEATNYLLLSVLIVKNVMRFTIPPKVITSHQTNFREILIISEIREIRSFKYFGINYTSPLKPGVVETLKKIKVYR